MQAQQSTDALTVIGFDPSMRNWGIAKGLYIPGQSLALTDLILVQTEKESSKQLRRNSDDLNAAEALAKGVWEAIKGAQAVFVEIPQGGQNARGALSAGVCIGVLGALRSAGIPFFELTPTEIKMASVGSKTASKADIISWATTKHPQAPWPTYKEHGQDLLSAAKAEHMADAVAAIYAGINSTQFKQLLALMKKPV